MTIHDVLLQYHSNRCLQSVVSKLYSSFLYDGFGVSITAIFLDYIPMLAVRDFFHGFCEVGECAIKRNFCDSILLK